MKTYIRIKFSKIDFFDFRLGGPGLGNLLFVWARAIACSEKLNYKLISPNWNTLKIGTYIRKEKDKRTYRNLFIDSGIQGFKKYLIQFFSISFIQNSKFKNIFKIPNVVVFSGMGSQMNDIINDHLIIKKKLNSILTKEVLSLIEKNRPKHIGVHVRFGDFQMENEKLLRSGTTNTRIPIKWYVDVINKLKNKFGEQTEFLIFSDGSQIDLKDILLLKNVYLAKGGNAISDMISLSYSKTIIASNSTFSLWSSYLGRCNTIWFPGTKRFNLFDEKENLYEFELDYYESLPKNLKL